MTEIPCTLGCLAHMRKLKLSEVRWLAQQPLFFPTRGAGKLGVESNPSSYIHLTKDLVYGDTEAGIGTKRIRKHNGQDFVEVNWGIQEKEAQGWLGGLGSRWLVNLWHRYNIGVSEWRAYLEDQVTTGLFFCRVTRSHQRNNRVGGIYGTRFSTKVIVRVNIWEASIWRWQFKMWAKISKDRKEGEGESGEGGREKK